MKFFLKKIFDLDSFFDLHFLETTPAKHEGVYQIGHDYIKCSPEECIFRIVDFLALWKKLEENKLIYTATDSSKTERYNLFTSTYSNQSSPPSPDFMYNQITRDYFQKVIFPDATFQSFVDNGYKTDAELYSENEERDRKINSEREESDRKRNYRLAFGIGVFSIILQIGATIWGNLTSTNERVVTIRPTVSPETTKVVLVNPSSLEKIQPLKINKKDSIANTATKKLVK